MSLMSPVHSFYRHGFFLLSLFCVLNLQSVTGRKLKFVVVVMRHGDRTPTGTYPNDPHKESSWPQGFGQLTTLGMQQQYEFGIFLGKRYRPFLSTEYKKSEVYIQSTDVDRTIMSAQANMAGLYPPTGKQIWNKGIKWQPIPVHTVSPKNDKLFFPLRNCKRFQTLLKETVASKEVQDTIKSNMELFSTLAKHTGHDVKSLLDLNVPNLYNVYSSLSVQKIHGLEWPKWVTSEIMEKMGKVLMYGVKAIFGVHKKDEKSRLQGGVLVKEILDRIIEATQSAPKAKLILYSAHDMTLIAVLMALNVFDGKPPVYASSICFDIFQEDNGDYTVEVHHRSTPGKEPIPLTLPGCTAACPLAKFKKVVAPVISDNWEGECNK